MTPQQESALKFAKRVGTIPEDVQTELAPDGKTLLAPYGDDAFIIIPENGATAIYSNEMMDHVLRPE